MAGIYSQGGSAGHRYAGWLSEVEAKNFQFGGKVFNGSPSAIYVGSNLVWANWLSKAAQQAIVGAFGQTDGMAVINATNAYLNQLAASGQAGKDKATALAGFINTYAVVDAYVVYSLVPTLGKIRSLTCSAGAYFDLGIIPNNTTYMEIEFKYTGTAYWAAIGGVRATSNSKAQTNFYLAATGTNQLTVSVGDAFHNSSYRNDAIKTIQTNFNAVGISSQLIRINGEDVAELTGTVACTAAIRLFKHFPTGNDAKAGTYISYTKGQHNGNDYWFIPINKDGEMELVDVVSGNYATRSGSFTEVIENTPSTP